MPLVDVTITQGRSPEQLRALIHRLHAAVVETVDAKPEFVRVIVREVPRTHWATGDVTVEEMLEKKESR
ncbi:tautomerase family protein [Kineosporia succinea]|uniref:4-oxalocrotonate tautomerase n=1 Tax=Kineosporia succinea TaxID=84632 RepID=A0ABT9NXL4_9ACTN|nr:tautomerase family protein [Kineosporia succinea]MDP9825161.1 4-oxalocrotonate tautomerase [Kineosporia succinea]